jgi:hypothetical protein
MNGLLLALWLAAEATPPGPIRGGTMQLEVVDSTGAPVAEPTLLLHHHPGDDHRAQPLVGSPPYEVDLPMVGGMPGAHAELLVVAPGMLPSEVVRIEGEAYHRHLQQQVEADMAARREGRPPPPAAFVVQHQFVMQPMSTEEGTCVRPGAQGPEVVEGCPPHSPDTWVQAPERAWRYAELHRQHEQRSHP